MECWALHLRLKTEKSKKLEQVLNQICGRLCVLGLFHFIWWKLQFLEKRSLWIVGAIYCFILDITWVDDLTEESGDFSVENLWRFITEWRSCFSGCADHPLTDRAKGWNIRTNAAPAIWFDLICERLNNGWAQCRLLPIHQIWNSGNMRFTYLPDRCVHWLRLRREYCSTQSSAKICPKFYSNQEYCTLTGFQLFCLIPNNWDW